MAGEGVYSYGGVDEEGIYRKWYTIDTAFPEIFDMDGMPDILPQYTIDGKKYCVFEGEEWKRQIYNENGWNTVTYDAVKEMIDNRRNVLGITDKMMEGMEVYGR